MLFAGFNVSEGQPDPVRHRRGGRAGESGGLADRLRGRLLRPARAPGPESPDPHQPAPPRCGGPVVRAPRTGHGLLHEDAADHPDLHLAPGRSRSDATRQVRRLHPGRVHPLGAWPGDHREGGRRPLGSVEGLPPLPRLRGDRRDRDRDRVPARTPAPRERQVGDDAAGAELPARRAHPDAGRRSSASYRGRPSSCPCPARRTCHSCPGWQAGAWTTSTRSRERASRWRSTRGRLRRSSSASDA